MNLLLQGQGKEEEKNKINSDKLTLNIRLKENILKNIFRAWWWWCMPLIPALEGRGKQISLSMSSRSAY